MEMNSKGQAAVTDALYFILIITFLSIFLFGFANSYGNNIKEQIDAEFNTTFATNALKSILYSSTARDVTQSLEQQDAEIDYLLAIVKEDYSDDLEIDSRERQVLGKSISSILAPVEDSLDYAFYITIPSEEKFVFFYFHTTNFKKEPYSASFEKIQDPNAPGRFYVYSAIANDPTTPKDESHTNYFCALGSSSYGDLTKKLSRLLANVGPTSQASSSIKLVRESTKGAFDDFKAQVDLVLWDAAWLGSTEERKAELFSSTGWSCIESTIEGQQNPALENAQPLG
ncbi:MAG TPA: hypothetical protein VJG83_00670 [archaeon]|nr:hypothetical protein [archaeon]